MFPVRFVIELVEKPFVTLTACIQGKTRYNEQHVNLTIDKCPLVQLFDAAEKLVRNVATADHVVME